MKITQRAELIMTNFTLQDLGVEDFCWTSQNVVKWTWSVVAPIIIIIGLSGNFLVLLVFYRLKFTTSSTLVHLFILALTDSVILCLGPVRHWVSYVFDVDLRLISDAGCKTQYFVLYVTVDFSAWILVSAALERSVSVLYPLHVRRWFTVRRALIRLLLLFVVLSGINLHFFFTNGLISSEKYIDDLAKKPGFHEHTTNQSQIHTILKRHFAKKHGSSKFKIRLVTQDCSSLTSHYRFYDEYIFVWIDLAFESFLPFVLMVVFNCYIISALRKTDEDQIRKSTKREVTSNSTEIFRKKLVDSTSFAGGDTALKVNGIQLKSISFNIQERLQNEFIPLSQLSLVINNGDKFGDKVTSTEEYLQNDRSALESSAAVTANDDIQTHHKQEEISDRNDILTTNMEKITSTKEHLQNHRSVLDRSTRVTAENDFQTRQRQEEINDSSFSTDKNLNGTNLESFLPNSSENNHHRHKNEEVSAAVISEELSDQISKIPNRAISQTKQPSQPPLERSRESRRQKRVSSGVTRVLILLTSVFLLTTLPNAIYYAVEDFIYDYDVDCSRTNSIMHLIWTVTNLLQYSYYGCNFLLYAARNTRFRTEAKYMMKLTKTRLKRRFSSSTFTSTMSKRSSAKV